MKKVLLVIITVLLITGCENSNSGVKSGMISCNEKEEVVSNGAIIIDVRTLEEYNEYHLDGAINIPYDIIENVISNYSDIKKDSNIIVYCKSGARSKKAYDTLKSLGYTNVYNLGAITKCV